ncbi:hypothetical protein, variant 1 [Phytophthora nicotianae CJ01A1]|uniref:Spen paralogue and orthologue SPOC C-terminal domain-containing protein n=6 Tax=Phytophthora nicotianae TaxID=4792 RepID=W2R7T7_PHYN3|nr:hypothetical protein, variant 1 [Phytophthora nicotianae INRA-310]ETI45374.1 hypothetical protein, variant 1 [Phytophthora nicotianae P1569]ETK85333.1 hypothetical protein, variant 1 [Phytophthora nicotianae]ETO74021.1 hypothetical protein, variant 1 [Phytophthora nicotianae P1976]ETP15187.1 hypothetical protein, variant 1 [Phytophthora nicotianae CJ01A1]ETP43259.1 hypothetical protein, variant 1 [Phytophthora nicotianae P10297]
MDYAELDKLIACCRQHPPQTVVVPATHGDIVPFKKFAKYLKDRQRAGVVILVDGRLLILAPLEKDDSRLRCVVVKAKSTAETSSALPSNVTRIRVDEVASVRPPQTQPSIALPEPESEQRQRSRVRSHKRGRAQLEGVPDTARDSSSAESTQSNQVDAATVPKGKVDMLYSLSRIERATTIAQLRYVIKMSCRWHSIYLLLFTSLGTSMRISTSTTTMYYGNGASRILTVEWHEKARTLTK